MDKKNDPQIQWINHTASGEEVRWLEKKKGPVTSHLSFAGEVIEITGREKNWHYFGSRASG